MSLEDESPWQTLERYSWVGFLVAGAVFLVDTALLVIHVSSGTEPSALGQGLIGTAWTAAFVGLVGVHRRMLGRNRWLRRAVTVFASLGALTMAVMALASFGYGTDVLAGTLGDVVALFLPGVFLGIVGGFGLFGLDSVRAGGRERTVGALSLVLVLTFLFNLASGIAGFGTLTTVLGVVTVLTLTMFATGVVLRGQYGDAGRSATRTAGDARAD